MDKRPFAIYCSVEGLDLNAVVDRLGKGITGKENHQNQWHAIPEPFIKYTPTQIINHHRTHSPSLNQSLLVIADRQDLQVEGLLVINLNFNGSPDALRQKVFFAGDFVPSVNVGETSWHETLANANLPLYPRRRFAVFAHKEFHPRYLMKDALEKMNTGCDGRRAGTGSIFAEWENVPAEGVGELVKFWRENGRERECDGRAFVVVTKEAWDEGRAVLVGGEEDGGHEVSEIRVDLNRIGDVLVWLYVGFKTFEEVEDMNDSE